eukprot:15355252-Ditylum_brightwellii.AAC.1
MSRKTEYQVAIPWPCRPIPFAGFDGWEVPHKESSHYNVSKTSLLSKISNPQTVHALIHLAVLEPSYTERGTVHYPKITTTERRHVAVCTSILGQVVSPSCTRYVLAASSENIPSPLPERILPTASSVQR